MMGAVTSLGTARRQVLNRTAGDTESCQHGSWCRSSLAPLRRGVRHASRVGPSPLMRRLACRSVGKLRRKSAKPPFPSPAMSFTNKVEHGIPSRVEESADLG